MASPPAEHELKRSVTLPLLTCYGLGTILGAGIYALVGEIAGRAGMMAPASFVIAAVLAAFTALSYAELSGRYPRSAGEAVYVGHAFSRRWLSTAVGLLVVLTGVVSSAAMADAFADYLGVLVELPDWIAITALVLALGVLGAWGISESITAAMIITLVEITGLLIVVWAARSVFGELPARLDEFGAALRPAAWGGIWLGAFLAFYAFIGFEDMVNVVEEVRDPQRSLPRAIFWAVALATALYVLVALTAVLAMPPAELGASEAPIADLYEKATGRSPVIVTLISLVAVTNGCLVQIIMGSRILYGLSRAGWLPPLLGRVHPATRTPLASTAIVTAVVLGLALWLPLVALAEATTSIILVVFALVNLSLLRVKRRGPPPPGVRDLPAWVPAAGLAICAGSLLLRLAA